MNKTTGLEGSGKFNEKLQLKQRQIEVSWRSLKIIAYLTRYSPVTSCLQAQMLENRLRKLHNEEVRLQKQIRIANKHSEFADQVKSRRDHDNAVMNWHKNNMQEAENRQRELNNQRRSANRQAIKAHQNAVLTQNAQSRQYLKQVSTQIMQDKT